MCAACLPGLGGLCQPPLILAGRSCGVFRERNGRPGEADEADGLTPVNEDNDAGRLFITEKPYCPLFTDGNNERVCPHPKRGLGGGAFRCSGRSKYFFWSVMGRRFSTCPTRPAATDSSAVVIQIGRPLKALSSSM